jgi:hypothetical protein
MPSATREKLGTAHSVPRRNQNPLKRYVLRRRVDRADCPHFFAPDTTPTPRPSEHNKC